MTRFSTMLGGARTVRRLGLGAALAAVGPLVLMSPLPAQEGEERALGWFYTAELSFVLTEGNAQSNTLGVGAGLRRVWERSELRLRTGALRTKTSRTTRTALGTPDDFEVVESSESELTAENYLARARYDYLVSARFFTFGGAGWERNTFAGFDSRISLAGGVGNIWVERERTHFKTDYGLTFTIQDDVVRELNGVQTFGGLRVGWDYWRRLTPTAEFQSVLVVDENLDDTDDLRFDFTNSLTLAISEALALRTGVQLLWDNQPSLVGVPLEQPAGTPTGETVFVPLAKLDTQFTVALVANF